MKQQMVYYQAGTDAAGRPIMRVFDRHKNNLGWLTDDKEPTGAYEQACVFWEGIEELHDQAKVLGLVELPNT